MNPPRVLLAKPGLDGHDRGIKVLAMALRDAGAEVIYLGLRRSILEIVEAAIEDDVEVGPLATIDAGTLRPTLICRGAKLDAQVHVGHNGIVGAGAIIAAQCGFAGSVEIGAGSLVGGQAGIADHARVGAGAKIAAKSGVIGDVEPGATVAGYPAVDRARWLRAMARALHER